MSKRTHRPAWKTVAITALALGMAVLVSGCGERTTLYEPGVYKGSRDPEATPQAAAAREEKLRERARLAHTDR